MRRIWTALLGAVVLSLLLGRGAVAQDRDRAPLNGPPLADPAAVVRLLQSPAGQADLRLTARQRQAVKQLAGEVQAVTKPLKGQNARQRAATAKSTSKTLADVDTKLRTILSPTQLQRIEQIGYQYPSGPQYLLNPSLASKIHLRPEQMVYVTQLASRSDAAWGHYAQTVPPGVAPAVARYEFLRMLESQTADLVLSDQQAAALRDAMGVPFDWSNTGL
ncbi:MAG: hypothetical protein KF708_14040 [Pirellulales bacterium]|nr:hypothetical protein [Pirellulales bacterium]